MKKNSLVFYLSIMAFGFLLVKSAMAQYEPVEVPMAPYPQLNVTNLQPITSSSSASEFKEYSYWYEELINDSYFYENFENTYFNWNLDSGWNIESIGTNTFLRGVGHYFAFPVENTWRKPGLVARFMPIRGTIHFSIRSNHDRQFNRYFIGVNGNQVYCTKQNGDKFISLGQYQLPRPLNYNQWHVIYISLCLNSIDVAIDNNIAGPFIDHGPLINEGGIAFETLDNSEALIDDVLVFPSSDTNCPWRGAADFLERTSLLIWSSPSDARIWIDGNYTKKRTPDKIEVTPGRHTIDLTKNGYMDRSEVADVPEEGLQLTWNLVETN
jgi:PEGA domain